MRRVFLILAVLILGCGAPEAGPEAVLEDTGAAPLAAADSADEPVVVVRQLYRMYEWEAEGTIVPDRRVLIDEPRPILQSYFSDELVDLILQDRACAAEGRVCNLDFSPIWASNDPAAENLEVSPTPDPEVVAVRFRYPGSQRPVSLQYRMIRNERGWRVADIEYEVGPSLRQILSTHSGVSRETEVSHVAFGAVRIGQLRSEAEQALGHPIPWDAADMVSDDCGHVALPGADGVDLMIFADTVVRIEVFKRGVYTSAGAQVGDTEREVLNRYGNVARVEPHPYVSPEGHYIVVPFPSDTMYQLIFETYQDTVTSYRVGRLPPVSWIEGCL